MVAGKETSRSGAAGDYFRLMYHSIRPSAINASTRDFIVHTGARRGFGRECRKQKKAVGAHPREDGAWGLRFGPPVARLGADILRSRSTTTAHGTVAHRAWLGCTSHWKPFGGRPLHS
jgi:hypothetical protein